MHSFSTKKYKIAIVNLTPFYYHMPLYKQLSESSDINLTVYYCSDLAVKDLKEQNLIGLFKGYNYKFLKNYSPFNKNLASAFAVANLGIYKEILKNHYDLVVLQAWDKFTFLLAFMVCVFAKTPIVFMTDTNCLAREGNSWIKKMFKKILLKGIIFKKADGFLTSGKANEEFYKKYGVEDSKMTRFHYSFGYEWFLDKAKELNGKKQTIRKKFGINESDFVLLFVGRIVEGKNIFNLLQGYNNVENPNKKLFIVGSGNLTDAVQSYIKKLDIKGVKMVGFKPREQLCDFYAMADAFILPSEKETWGIVVNEAMCFGLPIIVSDKVGAGPDLVQDGYNGFIFPAQDVKKLSEIIERLIKMDKKDILALREASEHIITKWISGTDPTAQILKLIEKIKA